MSRQYRKEKFKDRNEALIWCADNKPIYRTNGLLNNCPENWEVYTINTYWQDWYKAIEVVPEKRTIEVWVNVYESRKSDYFITKNLAIKWKHSNCLGTIKITKEITIVDGKVEE